MQTNIQTALAAGHQIWVDHLSRDFLRSGQFRSWLDKGVTGLTSNPSIFLKAIGRKDDYDELKSLNPGEKAAVALIDAMSADVREAARQMTALHAQSNGDQGYASIELNPRFANDERLALGEALYIRRRMGEQKNFMIKIASNETGARCCEMLGRLGFNVNMTLIFSVERALQLLEAWQRAMVWRKANGLDPTAQRMVLSFFVSRIDVALEPKLPRDLKWKVAVAYARKAYGEWDYFFQNKTWQETLGDVPRPKLLWASTGAKRPEQSPTLYVDALISANTVDTLPEKTLQAFLDKGDPAPKFSGCDDDCRLILFRAGEANAHPDSCAQKLFDDGLAQFARAYDGYFEALHGDDSRNEEEYETLRRLYGQTVDQARS